MNWPGVAAVILAAGVAVCVIALAVGTATQSGPISQEDATLLSTVLGAAVGAVATFLGGRLFTDEGATSSRAGTEGPSSSASTSPLPEERRP